jgi:CHAT domain-containing protein
MNSLEIQLTNDSDDSIVYLIFICSKDFQGVNHIILKEGSSLESNVLNDYNSYSKDKNVSEVDVHTYNKLWKPIADKIGIAKTVYVSLGGVYNNINLNTLYNPETGKYLIEEKDIRIVNSARDFVLMKERLSAEAGEKKQYTSTTSALYGFPDYNGITTSSVDTTDYLAATRDLNQIWLDSLTRGGMKASALPATKIEVDQIAATFQKNGWKVTAHIGENASETNIKKEVSPRVLHVATHGYFFEDIPMDKTDNRFLGMDRQVVVQDPMLRSGILFTGANKTLQGEEPKGENGLLSAAEASLLDLRETELVVLSACETGKGEIKNSEGVYGLRKAFADAGAQNIIMSLWKVDDKVTQEFMTRFYENWLNDKTSIR